MIIRVVRMTFKPEEVENFLKVFNASKHKIRGFEGCTHLDLLRDANHLNVFSTYSHWEKEEDLENYRQSELFKSVWSKTKVLFAEKPRAHSYLNYDSVML